jgi:hypothetical protein
LINHNLTSCRRKSSFQQLEQLKYNIYRLKPDAERSKKELLLGIVEDEYEKDPEVRQFWRKSVGIRRSRTGDKLTIEFTANSGDTLLNFRARVFFPELAGMAER